MHQLRLQRIVDYKGTSHEKQNALREDLLNWIEAHLDDKIGDALLRTFVEACDDSVSSFFENMRRGRGEARWGNELTLIACSRRFGVHIQVIHEQGLQYCRGYSPPDMLGPTIFVYYDGIGHYDSFEPVQRRKAAAL